MTGRIDYLDGCRGLAILGVVLVHSTQMIEGLPQWLENVGHWGSRGVQLFFVVSAFTLAAVYDRRRTKWGEFYVRRFFRIAPMFYIAALVYSAIKVVSGAAPSPFDLGVTLLFLHGLFPSSFNTVVPGGWSIGCEALFYAAFPMLLLWQRRLAWITTAVILGFGISAGLIFASMSQTAPTWATQGGPDYLYFSIVAQAPAFLVGLLVYRLVVLTAGSQREGVLCRAAPYVLGLVGLAIAVCASSGLRILDNFLVADLLFGAGLYSVALMSPAWLTNGLLAGLGRISFSVYLTHFLMLWPIEFLLSSLAVPPWAGLLIAFAGVLGLASGLSIASYAGIERPMMALGNRLTRRPPAPEFSAARSGSPLR